MIISLKPLPFVAESRESVALLPWASALGRWDLHSSWGSLDARGVKGCAERCLTKFARPFLTTGRISHDRHYGKQQLASKRNREEDPKNAKQDKNREETVPHGCLWLLMTASSQA